MERQAIMFRDRKEAGRRLAEALAPLASLRPVVLAVPLAPPDTMAMLAGECDEIVCLAQPAPFISVGAHYEYFDQTSDAEVVALLQEARFGHQSHVHRDSDA